MPSVGGLELQDRLKQRGIDLPVIIYMSNADVPLTVQAIHAGAFAVIEKPLSSELRIAHVRTAISGARARRARRVQAGLARAKLGLLAERELQVARHVVDGFSGPVMVPVLGSP